MRRRNTSLATLRSSGVLLALGLTGCSAILGLDDFKEGNTSSSGTDSSTSTNTTTTTSSNTSMSTGTHMGGGGSGSCMPGTMVDCYDGDPLTKDVGACKSGKALCDANGNPGKCEGEVVPVPETCNTPVDDDCNNQTNEGGDGCVCMPNMVSHCYDGPANTAGKGVCTEGTQTCNDQGTGFADQVCHGQVLPSPERCGTVVDDDCDGKDCAIWSIAPSVGNYQEAKGVATDASGNVYVVGGFAGTINFGLGDLVSQGGNDIFIVKFDPTGVPLWNKRFGLVGDQIATAVTWDAKDDSIAVAGNMAGTMMFDAATNLVSLGSTDVFLAKFFSDGTFGFARSGGGTQADQAEAIAATANDYVVAGEFNGTANFGGGAMTSHGLADGFIAYFDRTNAGTPVTNGFGTAYDDKVVALTAEPADLAGTWVACNFRQGTFLIDAYGFAAGPGYGDSFVANYTSDGDYQKGFQLKAPANSYAATMALVEDTAHHLYVGGQFNRTINFGFPVTSSAANDMFLATYDGAGAFINNGTPPAPGWVDHFSAFGTVQSIISGDMRMAMNGTDVMVGGDFAGTLNLAKTNGTTVPITNDTPDTLDPFVARFTATGDLLWAREFGGTTGSNGNLNGIASANGNTYIVGGYRGTIDFGDGPKLNTGLYDAFIAQLAP